MDISENNENTLNIALKKENINNQESDFISSNSKMFQSPYEKVLSILNKAIFFIKNNSDNYFNIIDDLNWVIKIIKSKTLYAYKNAEEEKVPKNGRRCSIITNKCIKFVAKYHAEVIEMNQNNILNNDSNSGKANNILLASSIKLKKSPLENETNSSIKKEKTFIKNDRKENYDDFKTNKSNNINNLQIINNFIINNENRENKIKENNFNKSNNHFMKNSKLKSILNGNVCIANMNYKNKHSKSNNSFIENAKVHLIEMPRKSPIHPKLSKEELKYFISIKNAMKDHYINNFSQNNPKIKSVAKNLKNIYSKFSESIRQNNRNTQLPQLTKKYFSPISNSINYKNDNKNFAKINHFSGDFNNIKLSKKLYRINNTASLDNRNYNNNLKEKDRLTIFLDKSISNEEKLILNKLESKSIKEKKDINIKKNIVEDKNTITDEIINEKKNKNQPKKQENTKEEKSPKKAELLSKLNKTTKDLYRNKNKYYNNNENNNDKSTQEEITQIIPFKSLKEKYQDHIKNVMSKDFNIFELKEIVGYYNIMPIIGSIILENFGLLDDNIISIKKLEPFLISLNNKYIKSTLYHNSIHGTDVTQTLATFFLESNIEEICKTNVLDLLGVFISGLGHDVGHPGLTNSYHINASTELALNYNDISCLENYHVSLLFKIIREDKNNIFEKMSTQSYKILRKRIISQILATDMANHGKVTSLIKSKVDLYKLENERIENEEKKHKFVLLSGNEKTKFDEQQSLLDYLIHSADLGHNTRPFNISIKWVELLSEEYWLQGDKEKKENLPISFLCDREKFDIPNSQVGFIKGFVITTYECLVTMFPSLKYTLENAENNIKEWRSLILQKRYKGWTPRNSEIDSDKEEDSEVSSN